MSSIAIIGLFCIIAYKTRPDKDSFTAFITNTSKKQDQASAIARISSFLTRVVSSVPQFKYEDYLIFSVVTLNDETATYVGLFGRWFVFSEVVGRTKDLRGEGTTGSGDTPSELSNLNLEAQAEADQAEAVKAKRERNHARAGYLYLAAAGKLEKSIDGSLLFQAASCYEDAYKAYNQAKRTDEAFRALENAANIFESLGKYNSRAGRLFEQLGELHQKEKSGLVVDKRKTLKMFEKAAHCFDMENDSRARNAFSSVAILHIQMAEYTQALTILGSLIPSSAEDTISSFRVKEFGYLSCLCWIAQGDWIALEKALTELDDKYTSLWRNTKENSFIESLIKAHNDLDSEAFSRACKDYDQYTRLPDWQISLLLNAKKMDEEGDLL